MNTHDCHVGRRVPSEMGRATDALVILYVCPDGHMLPLHGGLSQDDITNALRFLLPQWHILPTPIEVAACTCNL